MRPHDEIATLSEQVRRHPAERYPVQHATAQFHLGAAMAAVERLDEAERALRSSAEGFAQAGLTVEAAKAANQLGAVLRLAGRPAAASAILEAAAEALDLAGLPADAGAAWFNLGLARREAELSGTHDAFVEARRRLQSGRLLEPASHAAREAGVQSWAAGAGDRAAQELSDAVALARRAGATAAEGAAANVLGLVLLGAGQLGAARSALSDAVAAHPRQIRPADHAMAQANLALVHESAQDRVRARWAARHALGIAAAAPPVREQADGVLERLGDPRGDLTRLLESEPPDAWPALVRVELIRLAGAPHSERRAEAEAWIDHQLAHPEQGEELAATWLGAVLELEPEAMEGLAGDVVAALGGRPPDEEDRFRAQLERGMAHFHLPQMMRLGDVFSRPRRDEPAEWS